jgi:hypothetical protein
VLVGLVPPGVVTVRSTVPLHFGETAVIDVAEFTVKPLALVKRSASLVELVPPAVVTVTSTAPAPGGETAALR